MSEISGKSSSGSSSSSQSSEQQSTSGASSASTSASGSSRASSSQSTRSSNQKESKDAASFSEALTQNAPKEEAESLVQNTISAITHNDAKGSSSEDEASSGNETSVEKREATKTSGETQPAATTQRSVANDTSISVSDALADENTSWFEEALDWSKETASDIGDVVEDAWDWGAETASSASSAIGEFDRDNGAVLTRGVGVLQGVFGAAEAAGGVIIAGVGTGSSLTGVGAPVGVPAAIGGSLLIGNGIDNFWTGFETARTGEFQSTILAQASGDVARLAGASPETARNIENTVDIGSGLLAGGVAATVKTVPRMGVHEIPEVLAKADVVVSGSTRGILGGNSGSYFARQVLPGGNSRSVAGHGYFESGSTIIPDGSALLVPKHGTKIADSTGKVLETIDPDFFVKLDSKGQRKLIDRQLDQLDVTNRRLRQRVQREMRGVEAFDAGKSIPNYTISPPTDLKVFENSTTVNTRTPLSEILKPDAGLCTLATCTEIKGRF